MTVTLLFAELLLLSVLHECHKGAYVCALKLSTSLQIKVVHTYAHTLAPKFDLLRHLSLSYTFFTNNCNCVVMLRMLCICADPE